jgi:hypothetical protein
LSSRAGPAVTISTASQRSAPRFSNLTNLLLIHRLTQFFDL